MIHPFDQRPMDMKETAAMLGIEYDTFRKQVVAKEWEGAYRWIGKQRFFTLALIDEANKNYAHKGGEQSLAA